LYVEKVLAPRLKEGQIAAMDNLGAHRTKRVRELIEQRGAELSYLPAYSPEITTPSKRRLPRSRTPFATPRPGPRRLW